MYKKSDFQVGDKLYQPYRSRYQRDYSIIEHTIQKIGNKYLKTNCRDRIILEDLEIRDCTGRIGYAYPSEQEAKDFIEKEKLMDKVYWFCNTIRKQGVSLEDLRKINKIIDEIKGE